MSRGVGGLLNRVGGHRGAPLRGIGYREILVSGNGRHGALCTLLRQVKSGIGTLALTPVITITIIITCFLICGETW